MKKVSKDVDAYIARAPKNTRGKLKEIRAAIRSVAPGAVESISYMMPSYDKGKVAWFALMKTHVGLYLRPPIIAEHKKELATYVTTKSAVHFPLDKKLPVPLIKKLVKARIKKNSSEENKNKKEKRKRKTED
ncbi:MAG: DUF1801 domain-containing protein [Candidatus Micrarchaeota archaeon]|nr:DUF1801 domain-containing protein [Candidatus Micrarchaeota archaeon]